MVNSNSISEPQNSNFNSSHHNFPYKNLVVWQKSIQFASGVMDLIETLRMTRKNYRLFEQMEAAVTSIPMNIAEGKGRISKKEFCHFLMIARGSLYETLTLLKFLRFELGYQKMNIISSKTKQKKYPSKLMLFINQYPKLCRISFFLVLGFQLSAFSFQPY